MKRLVVIVALATGCATRSYTPTYALVPANHQRVVARAPDCDFDVLRLVPSRPFEEVGGW